MQFTEKAELENPPPPPTFPQLWLTWVTGCCRSAVTPRADSTKNLMHGKKITSVLDAIREKGEGNITPGDVLFQGYGGVWCVEAGGPTPGIGCAGRGIITAFEKLEEIGAYEICRPDIILYDVLGDVVCGGFAMPIPGRYARKYLS